MKGMTAREVFIGACGLAGAFIGGKASGGELMPIGALGLLGMAIALGALFLLCLARIAHKALNRLEKKLDDE